MATCKNLAIFVKLLGKQTNKQAQLYYKALACLSIAQVPSAFQSPSLLVVAIYSLYKKHNLYTSIRALNITALSKYLLLKQDLFEFCFQKNAAATILFIDIYIKIWIPGQETTLINASPTLFYNLEEN